MNARRAPDDPVEWLNRAESSLTQASHLLDGVYLEDLCAAAHQAAEKAIKSVLLKKAVDYPYVRPRKTPRTCTRLQHRSRDANANVARKVRRYSGSRTTARDVRDDPVVPAVAS